MKRIRPYLHPFVLGQMAFTALLVYLYIIGPIIHGLTPDQGQCIDIGC